MVQAKQNPSGPPAAVSHRTRRLLDCYKRGMQLATRERDYDYAHAMFAECVRHDPGNLQFVEAMVQNLRAGTPRSKKSMFRLPRGGSRGLKKALQGKQWSEVFRTGIELLKADPWDVTTLRGMAEACAALHHNEVELVYLKQALDAEPKNLDVNRHCARSLGRMGQFDQAIACWHRVEKLRGKDEEAAKMISMLVAEKLQYPGGRPSSAEITQPAAEIEEQEPEQGPRDVVLSPEQRLEQAIAQDPQNVGNYLELAELLLGSNQSNAAERVLSRAIAACGEHRAIVEQLDQVRFLLAEEHRRLAEARAVNQQINNAPLRIPWIELALGSAMVLLVLQLFPTAGAATWRIVDVTGWSRLGWFLFNVIVLLGLFVVRFGPDYRAIIRQRQVRRKHRLASRNG